MSQRPLLERASWIAGIASAVIAVGVWLKPNAPEPVPSAQAASVQPVPHPALYAAPTQGSSQPALTSSQQRQTRWSCEGIAPDLQPAINAAKNISYTSPRDEALLSIARKALCLENYELFKQVARQISYTAPRDQVYGDAVDFSIGLRKFELAEKFAASIAYTAPRDAARARIVAKASER